MADWRVRARLLLLAGAGVVAAGRARADSAVMPGPAPSPDALPPLDARADEVSFDARERSMHLRGNVVFDDPPFFVRSDRFDVRRSARGFDVQGDGRVGFCPCMGTPLAIAFEGATIAPPGDLLLRRPRLEIFGVPVLWSPFFWLRSPGRVGLLAPEIAYRGADGMRLGGGVHVPLRADDVRNGLDLRLAGYTTGGAAASVALVTPASTTTVRWDYRDTSGLAIDARGASRELAWDADILRGTRGLAETTDLDAAARPFDRAAFEASMRHAGFTFAAGMREVNARGGGLADPGAWGPVASVGFSEALAHFGDVDAAVTGGVVHAVGLVPIAVPSAPPSAPTLAFARGDGGFFLAGRAGAIGGSLSGRAAGDAADAGLRSALGGGATARGELALPFARAFPTTENDADPWVHRIEPRVTAAVLGVHSNDVLGIAPGRGFVGVNGAGWLAEASLYNALGRWGTRAGSELVVAAGLVGDGVHDNLIVRWRGATGSRWIGAGADVGRVAFVGESQGAAAVTRYRIGPLDTLHVNLAVSYREGMDPVLARLAFDAPVEPTSGLLARTGWTGGAGVTIPWTRALVTSAGVDHDFSARELVGARGGLELRDACGCLVLRGTVSHRLGRDGVDAWVSLDVIPTSTSR